MNLEASQPIGIFDSGVGGLTVVREIVKLLPTEDIIYFGDTARMPYGDKSQQTLQKYSLQIADFLLSKHCKLILIACNSASAAAFDAVKKHVDERAIVLNVIDPVVEFLQKNYANKHVGLIGTRHTISSKIYQNKLKKSSVKLYAQAVPSLASAIEAGFVDNIVIKYLLDKYLSVSKLENIEALILGCTHYPLIKKQIKNYYQNKVKIIDPSIIVAKDVKQHLQHLQQLQLLNPNGGDKHFFVSDYTEEFVKATKRFFSKKVVLEQHDL